MVSKDMQNTGYFGSPLLLMLSLFMIRCQIYMSRQLEYIAFIVLVFCLKLVFVPPIYFTRICVSCVF